MGGASRGRAAVAAVSRVRQLLRGGVRNSVAQLLTLYVSDSASDSIGVVTAVGSASGGRVFLPACVCERGSGETVSVNGAGRAAGWIALPGPAKVPVGAGRGSRRRGACISWESCARPGARCRRLVSQ